MFLKPYPPLLGDGMRATIRTGTAWPVFAKTASDWRDPRMRNCPKYRAGRVRTGVRLFFNARFFFDNGKGTEVEQSIFGKLHPPRPDTSKNSLLFGVGDLARPGKKSRAEKRSCPRRLNAPYGLWAVLTVGR